VDKQPKKLTLAKETLRNLDDQELSGVVGGTGTVICINTVVCKSGVCNSVVCYIDSLVCL
jgi:hypothetical protein